mmetsp:Transcript_37810/g.119269  ORF Transcript_37810/g.119269 Transcript_37810/m.119269 type:complete len:256 (+) Transcript_37810:49-816(+)
MYSFPPLEQWSPLYPLPPCYGHRETGASTTWCSLSMCFGTTVVMYRRELVIIHAYSSPAAHRSSSRARSTARLEKQLTSSPRCTSACAMSLLTSSFTLLSTRCACSIRASTLSCPASRGDPAAIFIIALSTTSGSCATTSAARSPDRRLKRRHLARAGATDVSHLARTPSTECSTCGASAASAAAVACVTCSSSLSVTTAAAITACSSAGCSSSTSAELSCSAGLRPATTQHRACGSVLWRMNSCGSSWARSTTE